MVARLDIRVDIWRYIQNSDDPIGGVQYTGTFSYVGLPMNIILNPTRQAGREQGLETPVTYQGTCQSRWAGQNITITELDEVTVTWPEWHQFYGFTFSVTGVSEATGRRERTPLHITMSRQERARRISY